MLNDNANPSKPLKDGTDLNKLISADKYFLDGSRSYLNSPVGKYNSTLSIETVSTLTNQRVIQTLVCYGLNIDKPQVWVRMIECAGFGLYPSQGTIYPKAWNRLLNYDGSSTYADNASAKTGGLVVGDLYKTSTGQIMIVY